MFHLTVLLLALGCQSQPESLVRKKIIEECQSEKSCVIKMEDFTNFQWDKLYVFNEGVTLPFINNELGFRYEDYTEFEKVMIFVKDEKITHKESENYNPSGRAESSIWFNLPSNGYGVFTPEDEFRVTQERIDGKVYYTLVPR